MQNGIQSVKLLGTVVPVVFGVRGNVTNFENSLRSRGDSLGKFHSLVIYIETQKCW